MSLLIRLWFWLSRASEALNDHMVCYLSKKVMDIHDAEIVEDSENPLGRYAMCIRCWVEWPCDEFQKAWDLYTPTAKRIKQTRKRRK